MNFQSYEVDYEFFRAKLTMKVLAAVSLHFNHRFHSYHVYIICSS